jgi:steroid 5-alpha reductase family enzyme
MVRVALSAGTFYLIVDPGSHVVSPFAVTFVVCGLITVAVFVLLWIVGTARRDVSLVDLYWGLGFAVVAWSAVALNRPAAWRAAMLATLTTVWGVRLAVHLTRRNWGHGEDRRYAAMRTQHGAAFVWVSLGTVFLLQAAILWFVSLPLQVAAAARVPTSFGLFDGLGLTLWTIGFLFETIGDWQLVRFQADPRNRGQVLDRGLWRYTRHPNYFGDACVWWGLYLVAAAGGAGWTVASSLVMTILLLHVSGVALLERTIAERRPEYAAYRARTNAFFPGPPKRDVGR